MSTEELKVVAGQMLTSFKEFKVEVAKGLEEMSAKMGHLEESLLTKVAGMGESLQAAIAKGDFKTAEHFIDLQRLTLYRCNNPWSFIVWLL